MRVADGCAVAAEVDGVHNGQCAAYAEAEAEQESDDGWDVRVHVFEVYRGVVSCGATLDGLGLPWFCRIAYLFAGEILEDSA